MHIETFSLGPLGTNCYIVSKDKECLIIDPGGDAPIIDQYLESEGLKPLAILLTHAHYDHIGALEEIRKTHNLEVYLHENEKHWLEDANLNRSSFFVEGGFSMKAPENILTAGKLDIGPFSCDVVHTPGHSPGSVSFIFKEHDFVVSGDVLFRRGIGRTDLPEGSIEQLADSIASHLYKLPDNFIVYPGHGPQTAIGEEKESNPFTLQFFRP